MTLRPLACSPPTWLAAIFALFYFSYGIYLPYWSLWLDSVGVSAHQIGFLLGLSMLARTLGNLLVMNQVRSAAQLLPMLRLLAWLSVLGFVGFYGAQSGLALLLLMLLVNFFYPTLIPLNDTLASTLYRASAARLRQGSAVGILGLYFG